MSYASTREAGRARIRRLIAGAAAVLAVGLLGACGEERAAPASAGGAAGSEAAPPGDALSQLRQALARTPDDGDLHFRLAEEFRARGETALALRHYHECRRLAPDHVGAHLAEAEMSRDDDPQHAIALLQEGRRVAPSDARIPLRLAELALARSRGPLALEAAEAAVALAPDDPLASLRLGMAHALRAREPQWSAGAPDPDEARARAVAALERSAELSAPERRWQPLLERARVLSEWSARADEASAAFRSAVEAAAESPDSTDRVRAAEAALAHARGTDSAEIRERALEQLVAADPGRLEAWVELAGSAVQAGRSGEAVLERMLEARSRDAKAHALFAELLQVQGRGEDAVAHLERAAADGIDPPVVLGALVPLLYALGRADEARATVERLEAEHPQRAETELARAQRLIVEGDAARAAPILRAAVRANAEDVRAERLLAQAELLLGNLDEADAAIDRAVRSLGQSPGWVAAMRAYIDYADSDCAGVLDQLALVERRSRPLERPEQLMAAACLYETDREAAGRRILEHLTEGADPHLPAVFEFAAREGARDRASARRILEHAARIVPRDQGVLRWLTLLDLQEGATGRALERLERVLASGAELPLAQLMRAELLARTGRLAEGEAEAARLFSAYPDLPGASELMVEIYRAAGKVEEAIAVLEKRGDLEPRELSLLAALYSETGDTAQERAAYERILAMDGDQLDTKNNLAFLLAQVGRDLDRARALSEEVVAALPKMPEALDTLGYVYLRMGRSAAAAARFREAIEAANAAATPRAEYHYHLGLAIEQRGRAQLAARSFQRALALDPGHGEAARKLAAVRASLAEE